MNIKNIVMLFVFLVPCLVFAADGFDDLCYSENQIRIESEQAVLDGFNFDRSCIYDDGGNSDGVTREIALRFNYSKSENGDMIFYDREVDDVDFLYINIRASSAPGFIYRQISRLESDGVVTGKRLGMKVVTGMKYTDKDVVYIGEPGSNYYYWCVEGGACGVVASLGDDSLVNYEVIVPFINFEDLLVLRLKVKSLLDRRIQK